MQPNGTKTVSESTVKAPPVLLHGPRLHSNLKMKRPVTSETEYLSIKVLKLNFSERLLVRIFLYVQDAIPDRGARISLFGIRILSESIANSPHPYPHDRQKRYPYPIRIHVPISH